MNKMLVLVAVLMVAVSTWASYVEGPYADGKCMSESKCDTGWVDSCTTGFGLYPVTFCKNLLYLPVHVLGDVTDCAASIVYRQN